MFNNHTLSSFSSGSDDGSLSPRDDDNASLRSTTSSVTFNYNRGRSNDTIATISSKDEEGGDVSVGDLLYALYPFQRPKRIRPPRRLVPRLFQSDPRRFYASMLMNALNSHDVPYMQTFIERYMIPQATLSRPAVNTEVFAKPSLLLVGTDAMLRYWSFLGVIVPDQTTQAENIRVVRTSNSESCKVVCDLVSSSTQIYDHQCVKGLISSAMFSSPEMEMKEVPGGYVYRSLKTMDPTDIDRKKRCFSDLNEHVFPGPAVTYGPLNLRLLPKPKRTQMAMTLTMHINELRQISALEYGSVTIVY